MTEPEEAEENPIATWVSDPTVLVLVDETRLRLPGDPREYIVFTMVSTTTERGYRWMEEASEIRGKMPGGTAKLSMKGKVLFGKPQRGAHAPFRDFFFRCTRDASAVDLLVTTNAAITEEFAVTPGKLMAQRTGDPSQPLRHVIGRELMPLLSAVRAIVKVRHNEPEKMTVVIDRSRQLGLSPEQAGIDKTQFDALVGPLKAGERTSYNLFAASDTTPRFQDLLLEPDAFGYILSKNQEMLKPAFEKLVTEKFWIMDGVQLVLKSSDAVQQKPATQ